MGTGVGCFDGSQEIPVYLCGLLVCTFCVFVCMIIPRLFHEYHNTIPIESYDQQNRSGIVPRSF